MEAGMEAETNAGNEAVHMEVDLETRRRLEEEERLLHAQLQREEEERVLVHKGKFVCL